ncbi:MAG: hypothetical protein KAT29_12835 [Anaerolineales bacterium]|nr:hypothetical protein [Anaerolineales bacterium]
MLDQLSGDSLGAITDQLGIDEDAAQKAISLALPLLIGSHPTIRSSSAILASRGSSSLPAPIILGHV